MNGSSGMNIRTSVARQLASVIPSDAGFSAWRLCIVAPAASFIGRARAIVHMVAARTIARLKTVSVVVGIRVVSTAAAAVGIFVIASIELIHSALIEVDTALSPMAIEISAIFRSSTNTFAVEWAGAAHLICVSNLSADAPKERTSDEHSFHGCLLHTK
ncbi:MAG: hypothetical protein U0136_10560 [Bdellovibrionota bacterium]